MMNLTNLFGGTAMAAVVALLLSAAMVGGAVGPALNADTAAPAGQGYII